MEPLIGNRYLVPYVRLFPIWRYGSIYGILGDYVGEGWYTDRYGQWECATRAEAEALMAG